MTNFLHWRRMTWALLSWSGAMTAWTLFGSVAATRVGVLWVAGMILFGLLWLATQPLYQQGRGLRGVFVKPRSPGMVRVEAEPRRCTGFEGGGRSTRPESA